LKLNSISCFVFLWDVYRVSLRPGLAPSASEQRGRGGAGHN
jgi:hypothetical protein